MLFCIKIFFYLCAGDVMREGGRQLVELKICEMLFLFNSRWKKNEQQQRVSDYHQNPLAIS